jgi:ribosomal protein L13
VPTYTPKAGDTTRSWYVIDATDVVLGRLAVAAANLLRGKHKPTFTPNVDGGDFVIVINADKVAIRVIPAVCASVRSVTRWRSTPTGSSRGRSSA